MIAPAQIILYVCVAFGFLMDGAWQQSSFLLDAGLRALAERLPAEARGRLANAGLISSGVLDAMNDQRPEVLESLFADAVGLEYVTDESKAVFMEMVGISGTAATKRRRCLAAAPAQVGVWWSVTKEEKPPDVIPARLGPAPPMGKPARWPTRLHRKLAGAPDDRARGTAERQEKERWQSEVARLILEDKLPAAQTVSQSADPLALLRRSTGGRRPRTLRQRVRSYVRIRQWMLSSGYDGFPRGDQGLARFLDFLHERSLEDCPRTLPQSLLLGLSFFEECGGVPVGERIANQDLVKRVVKDIEVSIASGQPRSRRKAPQYPVLVVVAFELYLRNESNPPYKRMLAWVKLVRIWGAMRFDDTLHIDPSTLALRESGLEFDISSTKTTGPGKRVEVLHAFVSRDAFLAIEEWCSIGLDFFRLVTGHLTRDYLLPLPSKDFHNVKAAPVTYSDSLNMTRALLLELCTPVRDIDRLWVSSAQPHVASGRVCFLVGAW